MSRHIAGRWANAIPATLAVTLVLGLPTATFAQATPSPGTRYGSREPQTCADKKTPARGAISAALATKYVICQSEGISGQYLYLVENVKVEVGASRPYSRNMDINVPNIDVRFPIYPIRGSLTKYQCKDPKTDYISIPGRTCNRTEMPKSEGSCYKTTFGDWYCFMTELFGKNEDYFPDVVPPGGKKPTVNDKPVDTKNTNQTIVPLNKATAERDANGFVKPDFSEMAAYFDIIRYEYQFGTREIYITATMKKPNNPNKWLVEFFDADGARLKWGNTILHYTSGSDPQVGQVVKVYTGTPTEQLMRTEVKRIKITRMLD